MDAITMTPQTTQVGGHHHHHGGGGKNMQAVMDSLSKTLGVSTDDLKAARQQGGGGIAALAASKGISGDQLLATITQALQQADPSLSTDRIQQIASRIASGGSQAPAGALSVLGGSSSGQGVDSDGDNDGSGGGYTSQGSTLPTAASSSVVSLLA